ncbi:putative porin [Dyella lipolytica]|uniref:Porin n=1 Tax=Dyella lipolytica TaxID=1867835 RepID=A0ABW8IXT4_9GAMM|nr:putative porin [Dyella lipolytica]
MLCIAVGLLLSGNAASAFGQDAAPSPNATVNLIRLMVKKGLISQSEADGLLKQANDEAAQARSAAAAAPAAVATTTDGAQPGDVRVTYVPQSVRNEIRDQVKQEVIAQAKSEHWAEPNALPDWLDRISWSGDVHVRDESWYYSRSNSPYFIDYGTLNRTGPFDVNSITQGSTPPIFNSQQNRPNMLRLQAHIGMNVKLGDTITAGVRIGSGGDNNPVSTTQTLGGGLIKKDIWLDQAWVRWQPYKDFSLTAGRMPDPFMVTDLIYSTELNFDGVAGHGDLPFTDSLSSFATLGAFPIQYVGNDAPEQAFGTDKNSGGDNWLTALQFGLKWKFADDAQWKVALAYYYFDHMQGRLSAPCLLYTGINYCSTDDTAPQYMQKGNTVFLLRDIVPNPSSPDNYAQPQFVGLSYNYHVADLTNKVDFKIGETPMEIQAEYERNMAYHARDAFDRYPNGLGQPVNNFQAGSTATTSGPYKSGPVGWLVRGIIGNPNPMAANEWNIALGYKYLQPDAVLDGMTDQNFHLGGTNAKGFILTADYGIAERTWVSARYFGAKQVYGPPFTIDVVQLEVSTKF